MASCLIALGANLGDRLAQLRSAVAVLRRDADLLVKHVSPLYETATVGGPEDQGAYLNAAAIIETELPAETFLNRLHEIEALHERERLVRWGARTLDLDLLTYDDFVSDQETLELPHPRMHQRRFVMVPVCDIAADVRHPKLQQTMQELLSELPVEAGDLTLFERDWAE
ncbi:MAG: 2-amino-4-hydroxy-6-hydroxymethyldihydropteridine diphosphokinase [Pseudomonadota bacterium]